MNSFFQFYECYDYVMIFQFYEFYEFYECIFSDGLFFFLKNDS